MPINLMAQAGASTADSERFSSMGFLPFREETERLGPE